MKGISSLPKECTLNINVATYKHTALKLNKPVLIVNETRNFEKPAYYISFNENEDISSFGRIVYYDEMGYILLTEYYYLRDKELLFRTRFKQIQKEVVYTKGIIYAG